MTHRTADKVAQRRQRFLQWTKARKAEIKYNQHLRALARQVGMIVRGMAPNGAMKNPSAVVATLRHYAQTIEPWAESVAHVMVADVENRDLAMWRRASRSMSKNARTELESAPTGELFRALQASQVELIKSIPLQAAERVHELSQKAMLSGARAAEISAAILETEDVSRSRAMLIARTETGRAASNFMQARASWAGSEGYFWRTAQDGDVRRSHDEMDGRYVRWDSPPTLDNMVGHAGCLPNCRCFAEPTFPDD